jgi:phage tail sheath protein FI
MNILSFIDRPITKAFLEDLQDFENAYLNTLKGRDAVIEAVCYIKPEDNPPEQLANGQVVVDLVLTPVYPAERITHQIVLDIEPLRKLFE